MAERRRRYSKPALTIVVWLFPLCQHGPPCLAQQPGMLQFQRELPWEQELSGRPVFSPDGKMVACFGLDWFDDPSLPSAIRLWAVDTGIKLLDLKVPGGAHHIHFFWPRSAQSFLRLVGWNSQGSRSASLTTELITDAAGHEIQVSPDGTRLASTAGKFLWMIDLASKKITATKFLEDSSNFGPRPMAFSPNGKLIATAREDRLRVKVHEVELCDTRTLGSNSLLRDDAAPVASLSYSPDGLHLAIGDSNGGVTIWDASPVKRKRKVSFLRDPHTKTICDVVFSPDGKLLGVGGTGTALLLRVDTLEVVDTIKGHGGFTPAFSPDGSLLLTGNWPYMRGHDIRLWRVQTVGKQIPN